MYTINSYRNDLIILPFLRRLLHLKHLWWSKVRCGFVLLSVMDLDYIFFFVKTSIKKVLDITKTRYVNITPYIMVQWTIYHKTYIDELPSIYPQRHSLLIFFLNLLNKLLRNHGQNASNPIRNHLVKSKIIFKSPFTYSG